MGTTTRGVLASLAALSVVVGCSGDPPASDAGSDGGTGAIDSGAVDSGAVDSGAGDGGPRDAANGGDAGGEPDAGGHDAATALPSAYVSDSCGPADGPALQLLLFEAPGAAMCSADDTRRTITFYVHDLGGATLPPVAGDTITSTAAASSGTASECPGGSPPCRLSETWTLFFETYAPDGDASGTYAITWGDGSTSSGQFDATRCETGPVLCG